MAIFSSWSISGLRVCGVGLLWASRISWSISIGCLVAERVSTGIGLPMRVFWA